MQSGRRNGFSMIKFSSLTSPIAKNKKFFYVLWRIVIYQTSKLRFFIPIGKLTFFPQHHRNFFKKILRQQEIPGQKRLYAPILMALPERQRFFDPNPIFELFYRPIQNG
ncbi:MAG: hypothetical protein H6577_20845 [Lewinellaceae bacterium]|nr:hypothetical protein [Lewinellaceae bacterium]